LHYSKKNWNLTKQCNFNDVELFDDLKKVHDFIKTSWHNMPISAAHLKQNNYYCAIWDADPDQAELILLNLNLDVRDWDDVNADYTNKFGKLEKVEPKIDIETILRIHKSKRSQRHWNLLRDHFGGGA